MLQLPMDLLMENLKKSVGINFTDELTNVKNLSIKDASVIKILILLIEKRIRR